MSDLEKIQPIGSDSNRINSQFKLTNAYEKMVESYNSNIVELQENSERENINAQNANRNSKKNKYLEALPSGGAVVGNISAIALSVFLKKPEFLQATNNVISLASDAGKKPFEAKGIASSGKEQYSRIALEKLKEMVSMIARSISEMASHVTNINSKNGGM